MACLSTYLPCSADPALNLGQLLYGNVNPPTLVTRANQVVACLCGLKVW